MKYNIGDKVKIRSDLEVNKQYGNLPFLDKMAEFKGEVLTIIYAGYTSEGIYYCCFIEDEYRFRFTDEMIEGKVEDMNKKQLKGWELIKEISEGKIKADTKIKQTNITNGYDYDLVYNGSCIVEADNICSKTDSGELLDEDYVYEIIEEESNEEKSDKEVSYINLFKEINMCLKRISDFFRR